MLLVINLALSAALTGILWFVQVAHYPLLARVPPPVFPSFEQANTRRTSWVVGPLLLAEFAAAITLAAAPPTGVAPRDAWAALALLAVAWASTLFLQVPAHRRLERAFDARVHRRLVATNWIRTVAWTLRTTVLTTLAVRCIVD